MKRMWSWSASVLLSTVAGGSIVKKLWLAKYQKLAKCLADTEKERDLLYTWVLLQEKKVSVTEYFEVHGYSRIAILGMERIGRRFCEAVSGEAIFVEYGVEANNFGAVHEKVEIYRLGDDPLPPADCLVICDFGLTSKNLTAIRQEFPGEIIDVSRVLAWLLERNDIKPKDGAIAGWPFI